MSMKNYLLTFLTTTALFFATAPQARASHAVGADIFYECVGQDSFLITLNFYWDCIASLAAPTNASIGVTNTCTGTSSTVSVPRTARVLPEDSIQGYEISDLCPAERIRSRCNGGTLPGIRKYQYTFLWVAPAECANWRISYDLNARNAAINTLQNPGGVDLYIEAFINNTTHPTLGKICNNSPTFTSKPVPYFCYQDNIFYNQGAIDIDGDSLVYTMIQPLQNPGTVINYAAGFSVAQPISTIGPFNFNPLTGQMSFVPQQQQVGVVTVRIDEYRNGILIGSTMRDIQVVILGAALCTPPYNVVSEAGIDSASVTGAEFVSPYILETCPGNAVSFLFPFSGANLTITSNATQALPGATFTTTNIGTDSVVAMVQWVTTGADTGSNVFTINYSNDNCPIPRSGGQAITINVLPGTDAGPDRVYCSEGQPIQLNVVGGTMFTWSPADGLSDPNIRNPIATPTVTTDYIVQSDLLASRCKNSDTVRVTVVPNFIYTVEPQNDTVNICRNALVFLDVDVDPNFGPYTYSWSPSNGLTSTNIANPVASPILSTTYFVEITSDTGCTLRDSLRVNIVGVGPQVNITPESALLCPGTSLQLNTTVLPVTCGPSVGIGSCGPGNIPTPRVFGTGTTTSSVTPFSGQSSSGRYQVLYRAADLIASGYTAGTINRMQLNVGAKASNANYQNLSIKMGCTSSAQLTRANWLPAPTTVYNSASQPINQGVNTFVFNPPYDWDGVSNLVIEFCYGGSTAGNAGGNDLLLSTTVPYAASMSATSTASTSGCNLPPSAIPVSHPVTQVPNLTFFICGAIVPNYTYQWSPAAGLSNATIPNPTASPTVPTTYTLTVSDSVCNGQDFTTINIDTSRLIITSDTSLCNADSIQLAVDVLGVITFDCGFNGNGCDGNRDTTVVGTGTFSNTTSGYPSPYSNNYESVRQQYLYRAADLLAAGVTPGRLTNIGFNILSRQGTSIYRNFTIKIACTNTAALTQGTPEVANFVTVFNPKNISLPASGWTNHIFDNHFDWDGTTNLLIEVCFNNDTDPSNTTNVTLNTQILSTNTGYTASAWYPVDNQDACAGAIGLPNNLGASTNRPNIRLFTCDAAPPFTVSWSPINTLTNSNSTTPTAFPTVTTTYTATATTFNGCVKQGTVTVTVGTLPYTTTPDTTICSGSSAQLFVFGNAGYTYNWTTATNTLSCTNCSNPIATPDSTTVYYFTVDDGNCSVTDSIVVTVFNLAGNVILNPGTLCVFDSTLLLADAGYSSYLWSTGSDSAVTWVYSAGTYSVTITDASGCTAADTIDVLVAAAPEVNLGNDTSICAGDSVVLSIGGNYVSYNWNVATTTNTEYTVLTTGNYQVTVVDANGCESNDSIQVFVNTVPIVDLGPDTAICDNETLVLDAGFQPGYTYTWQDGTTGNLYTVDTTGVYHVTVFGGATCFASDTIEVTVNPAPVVDLGADIVACQDQGVVILRAGQGFDSYLWSPTGTTLDSLVVAPISGGGTYSVTVSDAIGCSDSDTITVTFNNPTLTLVGDTVCEGESVTLDAGVFAEYSWSTSDTTRTITVDTSGTFTVVVTDAAGCTATSTATVVVLANPTVSITSSAVNDSICPGSNATLEASAGFATYEWSTNATTQTIQVQNAGVYTVTATNASGCSAVASYELFEYPFATLELEDQVLCPSETLTYIAPAGYVTYNWSNGSQTDSIIITQAGEYILTVTNVQGCGAIDTLRVFDGGFTVTALVDPSQVDLGNPASLDVDVLGGTGNYTYNWTPSTYLDLDNVANPTATPDSTITYQVVVTDEGTGCTATDTISITVFNDSRFAFSDAFSPNGDGHNDFFFPIMAGNVAVTTFQIYNRWGEQVHNAATPWDGTINGTQQPMGTYVYYAVIEITSASGVATEIVQGSFTLLR